MQLVLIRISNIGLLTCNLRTSSLISNNCPIHILGGPLFILLILLGLTLIKMIHRKVIIEHGLEMRRSLDISIMLVYLYGTVH